MDGNFDAAATADLNAAATAEHTTEHNAAATAELMESLIRVMREFRRCYDNSAREGGLTMSRARVLSSLAQREGVTQAELAAELEIEAPSLKRLIDALEVAGLIERRPIETDARKKALYLTPEARRIPVTNFLAGVQTDLLRGLNVAEQAVATSVLHRVAENAAALRAR